MKQLKIDILEAYKSYTKISYNLDGELIILSGVNGSGKTQLFEILSKKRKDIKRKVYQTFGDSRLNTIKAEEIYYFSFRDNISIGDFTPYNLHQRNETAQRAWNFYRNNTSSFVNAVRSDIDGEGASFYYTDGKRFSEWKSGILLAQLIKKKIGINSLYSLTVDDIKKVLPEDFVWRSENDIVSQTSDIFYKACCNRVNEQIKFSKTNKIFPNEEWIKKAPWTLLNKLFQELGFKYSFKKDYEFKTPDMEETPKLRIGDEIRKLDELSDGEKTILKLALISLDEDVNKNAKVILFDEYDATLNPSLIEAFYKVIDEFYVKKGKQVIIATHSSTTISLAPSYASFYEIFIKKDNASPNIIRVNQYEYAELKEANKNYYDKLKDQIKRETELIKETSGKKSRLLVEDEYIQIYKLSYLKIKNIQGISEDNIDALFDANANFEIHGGYSAGGLYNILNCKNITEDNNIIRICLFDFDAEGYGKFEKTKKLPLTGSSKDKMYSQVCGDLNTGLYIKHKLIERYAMMIPIPVRLANYVSTSSSSDCFIEMESLLSEEHMKNDNNFKKRSAALPFYIAKDSCKKDLWKTLIKISPIHFNDFIPLFQQIGNIFNKQ